LNRLKASFRLGAKVFAKEAKLLGGLRRFFAFGLQTQLTASGRDIVTFLAAQGGRDPMFA
jgi:hypothetical protein